MAWDGYYDPPDMPDIRMFRETKYVARKEHKCCACREPIAVGQKYVVTVGKDYDNNRFFADKWHYCCPITLREMEEERNAFPD